MQCGSNDARVYCVRIRSYKRSVSSRRHSSEPCVITAALHVVSARCRRVFGHSVAIWYPLRAITNIQGPELAGVFHRVAGLLTVLWIAYPTVWLLGPSGLGLLNQIWDTALFVPIISKVGWRFFELRELRSLKAAEQAAPCLARA